MSIKESEQTAIAAGASSAAEVIDFATETTRRAATATRNGVSV